MKVLEQTSSRLKLQHNPVQSWSSAALLTTLSLAGFVYCLGIAKVSAHLQCRHAPPASTICELQQFTALGRMQTHKLYDLQGAEVIRESGGKGGPRYRVEVFNGEESVTLLHDSQANYQAQTAVAEQINQFVGDHQQETLSIDQSAQFTTTIFTLFSLFSLVTGIILSLTPAITCTFYKRMNQVVLERQRWHQQLPAIECALHEISRIDLDEKRVKHGRVYRVVLILHSGKRIPLTQDFTNEKTAEHIAWIISQFLTEH